MRDSYPHLADVAPVTPSSQGCEKCLQTGSGWVRLRLCLVCGHVGCCDNSPNRHASAHFHAAKDAVMRSFEPGETWGWCYVDDLMFDPMPEPATRRSSRTR